EARIVVVAGPDAGGEIAEDDAAVVGDGVAVEHVDADDRVGQERSAVAAPDRSGVDDGVSAVGLDADRLDAAAAVADDDRAEIGDGVVEPDGDAGRAIENRIADGDGCAGRVRDRVVVLGEYADAVVTQYHRAAIGDGVAVVRKNAGSEGAAADRPDVG